MTEGDDVGAIEGCASAVGKMLLQIILTPWAAFVAWTIWRWFGVGKMGAPSVPFAAMGGLLEGASIFRLRSAWPKGETEYTVVTIVTGYLIVPALILGVARIWLVFA